MKNFGFGCMRLPMIEGKIDYVQFKLMIDRFLENGFTYFDTAIVYHQGESEKALRECLVKRYPREKFVFADKLSGVWEKEEDILPLFNRQLENTGLEYFDYYLMHSQGGWNYPKYKEQHAYEIISKLKEEGKIKHFGISFHDSPEFLEVILKEQPAIEFVQLQFNYLDYDNPNIQARRCYEVARKYGKQVIIMEPVKGGHLVNLSPMADKMLKDLNNGSNASYALRFAGSFDGVFMVLSGMSSIDQMEDNIKTMKEFKKLSKEEMDIIFKVADAIKDENTIPCTGCKYCVDGCPMKINIPEIFKIYNNHKVYSTWGSKEAYNKLTLEKGKASSCIKCGKCEIICPQHLKIRDYLVEVSKDFEK